MTRRSILAAAALAAASASPAAAQSLHQLGVYPDTTTFTSRGGLPPATGGDVLMRVRADEIRGAGQAQAGANVVGRVNGFRFLLQDEEASTRELFDFVLLRDDPGNAGRPDTSAQGVLLRTVQLQSPAGSGGTAWQVTATLQTPADVLPQTATFYHGVGLPAFGNNDGLSIHGASYTLGTAGDNPAAGAPNPLFTISRPANTLNAQLTPGLTNRMFLMVEGAVLNTGADVAAVQQRGPNPSFGMAGLYPDGSSSRRDGIALRVRDTRAGGGTVALFVSAVPSNPPLRFAFAEGAAHIDALTLTAIGTAPIPGNGEAVIAPAFLAVGRIPIGVIGRLAFLGLTVQGATLRFTNTSIAELRVL